MVVANQFTLWHMRHRLREFDDGPTVDRKADELSLHVAALVILARVLNSVSVFQIMSETT